MSFLIAPEDKTFIYALGPGGTNTFFCHVQSAGPERISKAEKEAIAAIMADAPALLEALKDLLATAEQMEVALDSHYDCRSIEAIELDGELPDEIIKARALIAKHGGGV